MLHRRLIQLWLHAPTAWKNADGYGRYLHRAAVAPFTPAKVVATLNRWLGFQIG